MCGVKSMVNGTSPRSSSFEDGRTTAVCSLSSESKAKTSGSIPSSKAMSASLSVPHCAPEDVLGGFAEETLLPFCNKEQPHLRYGVNARKH